jgi:hypothetical protein
MFCYCLLVSKYFLLVYVRRKEQVPSANELRFCVYLPGVLARRRWHSFNLKLHSCVGKLLVCLPCTRRCLFGYTVFLVFEIQTSLTSELSRAVFCLCVTCEAYCERKVSFYEYTNDTLWEFIESRQAGRMVSNEIQRSTLVHNLKT